MKSAELAWAAGLIDGEGTIVISRTKPSGNAKSTTYNLRISVQMTHKPALHRLKRILRIGRVYFRQQRAKGKPMWVWSTAGTQNAAIAISKIRRYLVVKAREADIALKFVPVGCRHVFGHYNRVPKGLLEKRESFYQKLKAAKNYRWEKP